MAIINTNVAAIAARNALATNQRSLDTAMERLSTGSRINSASDDAAGLAMSENMKMYRNGLDMAVRNAGDAISLLQTIEGAMVEQTAMMQRMRELAVQAQNDTTTDAQKDYLDVEFQALKDEIDRISTMTEWNGTAVLAGTWNIDTDGSYVFQVGSDEGQEITMSEILADTSASGIYADITSSAIDSTDDPSAAIGELDDAIAAANEARADLGSLINRLGHAIENLSNVSMNTSASLSKIADTDYAAETTNLARTQIIQQAATAMLAQANQSPATVLALLQ